MVGYNSLFSIVISLEQIDNERRIQMGTSPEWLSVMVEIIGNLGFPIFVAWFLLQRMENKLDELVKAIQYLNQVFNNTGR